MEDDIIQLLCVYLGRTFSITRTERKIFSANIRDVGETDNKADLSIFNPGRHATEKKFLNMSDLT